MLALTCFMSRQSDLSSFLCEPTKYSLNLILAANTVKHIYIYKQYTWNINAVCVLLEKIIHLKTMFYMEQNQQQNTHCLINLVVLLPSLCKLICLKTPASKTCILLHVMQKLVLWSAESNIAYPGFSCSWRMRGPWVNPVHNSLAAQGMMLTRY